jgi:hypothetical protein
MAAGIVANVDLQERGSGIVLVTGPHGFPESPQGLLGRQEGKWSLEDSYGDTERDGATLRKSFFGLARKREAVIEKWLRHLGIDPGTVEIKTDREY